MLFIPWNKFDGTAELTEKIVFSRLIMLEAISSSSADRADMSGSIRPVCKLGTLKTSFSNMLASIKPLHENRWINLRSSNRFVIVQASFFLIYSFHKCRSKTIFEWSNWFLVNTRFRKWTKIGKMNLIEHGRNINSCTRYSSWNIQTWKC